MQRTVDERRQEVAVDGWWVEKDATSEEAGASESSTRDRERRVAMFVCERVEQDTND